METKPSIDITAIALRNQNRYLFADLDFQDSLRALGFTPDNIADDERAEMLNYFGSDNLDLSGDWLVLRKHEGGGAQWFASETHGCLIVLSQGDPTLTQGADLDNWLTASIRQGSVA